MKTMTRFATHVAFGFAGVSLALASCAAPAPSYKPGQRLSQEKAGQLGELPTYRSASATYRVLPQKGEGGTTLVLTEQGEVAASRHEVLVADVPEARVQAAAAQGPRPASVQHYESTGITVLRYADFAQTVQGLTALQAALPGSVVRLPLELEKKVPY